MKIEIKDAQVDRFCRTCADAGVGKFDSTRAALEDFAANLPEPIPTLRPIAEMPEVVPEGCVRLFDFDKGKGNGLCNYQSEDSTCFIDILRLSYPVDRARVEFEAAMKEHTVWRFERHPDGTYDFPATEFSWIAWNLSRKSKASHP